MTGVRRGFLSDAFVFVLLPICFSVLINLLFTLVFFRLCFVLGVLQLGQHCCAALQVCKLRQAGDVVQTVAFHLFLAGGGGHVFYWEIRLAVNSLTCSSWIFYTQN